MKNHGLKMRALAALLLLTAAQANASNRFHDGFYLGGALGAGWGHATWDGLSTLSAINDDGFSLLVFESWTPDGDSLDTEFSGKAMLGYQFVRKPLYLAFEIGGTFSEEYAFDDDEMKSFSESFIYTFLTGTAQINDTVTLGSSEFNIDLKPGWLFEDNFLIYARIGLAVNELTIDSSGIWTNDTLDIFNVPVSTELVVKDTSSNSKTAYGIRLGLGSEYLVTQNLGITLDYTYTDYGSITTTAEAAASGDNSGNFQINVNGLDAPDVTVSTQTLMLGLLYHW